MRERFGCAIIATLRSLAQTCHPSSAASMHRSRREGAQSIVPLLVCCGALRRRPELAPPAPLPINSIEEGVDNTTSYAVTASETGVMKQALGRPAKYAHQEGEGQEEHYERSAQWDDHRNRPFFCAA